MNLLSSIFVKIIFFFGLLSSIISFVCGLLIDNLIYNILKTTTMIFVGNSIIAFFCIYIIKLEVPEIIQFLEKAKKESFHSQDKNFDLHNNNIENEDKEVTSKQNKKSVNKTNNKDSDFIVIDDVKVKNEPELMAKAVQTMLSKDEE